MNNAMLSTPIGDLQCLADWIDAHGGDNDDLPRIVEEMHGHGLSWADIRPYSHVLTDIPAVRECIDCDISPSQLEVEIDGTPLGHMVSDNDITAPEARQMWEDSE